MSGERFARQGTSDPHVEIEQGACRKKAFERNGTQPSRWSWALSLESALTAFLVAAEGDIWN